MDNAKPLIKTENLSVVYELGKRSETVALKDADVEIYSQEYVIFFGPSGCGKSTLLYSISGLETPTSGKVYFNGKNLTDMSQDELHDYHRKKIGFIFQAYYLIPTLSVLDNILMPQMLLGEDPTVRLKRARELLSRFGIEAQAKHLPAELSGGQQQRTAIARALVNDPQVILADEPVGNLDSKRKEEVMNILYELNAKDKKTVILVTHDPTYLSSAHRIFYMKDGQVIKESAGRKYVFEEVSAMTGKKLKATEAAPPTISLREPAKEATVKAISDFILKTWEPQAIETFEQVIRERLEGRIDIEKMQKLFDIPLEEGGVGLYRQTAKHLAQRVEEMIKDLEKLDKSLPSPTGVSKKVPDIRHFILDDFKGKMSFKKVEALDKLIQELLEGKINASSFSRLLKSKKMGLDFSKKDIRSIIKRLKMLVK